MERNCNPCGCQQQRNCNMNQGNCNMNQGNCNNQDCNPCNYQPEGMCICDKYMEKSNELLAKSRCIQKETQKTICEANELENCIKDLEEKLKQLRCRADGTWQKVYRLEKQSNELLEYSKLYYTNASECYKRINNSSDCRFMGNNCCDSQCSSSNQCC